MLLNGEDFKTYFVDTTDSITIRIAAKLSTSPRWLIFQDDIDESANVKVVNYLDSIYGSNSTRITIPEPLPKNVTIEEAEKIFIASNRALIDAGDDDNSLRSILYSMELDRYKLSRRKFQEIYSQRRQILQDIKNEIDRNKRLSDDFTLNCERLDKVQSVESNPYEITHVQFTIDLGVRHEDIKEIFNDTVPNNHVPYVACSTDLFKIFQEFHVNPAWLEIQSNNVLLLKVNSTREIQKSNVFKNYMNAAFIIDDKKHLMGTLDIITVNDIYFLSKDEYIDRVLSVFDGIDASHIINSYDVSISAKFIIPNQCLDSVIVSDIVMFDDIISKFLVIDEFIQASRSATNSSYIKYIHNPLNTITLTLNRSVESETFVMCRVRTSNVRQLENIKNLTCKMFDVYNKKFDQISQFYRQYLSPKEYVKVTCDTDYTKISKKGRKGIAAIEPGIYPSNYSRMCNTQPIIIEKETDAPNGHQVMSFPMKGERDSQGVPYKTRLYTCDIPGSKYIGLRPNNKLENRDQFPYLPCCFVKDQISRKNSGYNIYFNDTKPKNEQDVNEDEELPASPVFIRDGKVMKNGHDYDDDVLLDIDLIEILQNRPGLEPGKLENLPDGLDRFFKIIDLNPYNEYVRCGIVRTRFSALEAILYARGEIKYRAVRSETRINRMKRYIAKLMNRSREFATSVKQEFYIESVDEIQDIMKTAIFTPSKFVRLLELWLSCDIFVFTPEDGLLVPNHAKIYLKSKPVKETILLYEHSGGVIELIGVKQTNGPKESFRGSFNPKNDMILNLYDFFKTMCASYYRGVDGLFRELPQSFLPSRLNIVGQTIDSYGKCRIIVIDEGITIVLERPIAPFDALIVTDYPRTTIAHVLRSFKAANINSKRCKNGRCRELGIKIGNVIATILVNDPNHRDFMRDSKRALPMYENLGSENAISTYQNEKREAYEKLKDAIVQVDAGNLDESLQRYAMDNGGLTTSNVRLLHAVKQWIKTHRVDETTLKSLSIQILKNTHMTYVLNGVDAVKKLMLTYEYDYDIIFHRPRTENNNPYFFRCNDTLYLAIPTKDIKDANDTIHTWNEIHRVSDEMQTSDTYKVYLFIDVNDIRLITYPTEFDDREEGGIVMLYKNMDKIDTYALLTMTARAA